MEQRSPDAGSFRDPSGVVYRHGGELYRQIHPVYAEEWEAFARSGLAERLIAAGDLVAHEEVPLHLALDERASRVIRPDPIEFISYPYEWTFGELRDAALLTLRVQAAALEAGFTLKDATAYNVQFRGGSPVLIDSLSFERVEDRPWVAYRQFCEHFLAPLALMAYRDVRCGLMLRDFIDGIPLDLATALLPGRTRLRFGLAAHLHLHAGAQRRNAGTADGRQAASVRMSRGRQQALVESLRGAVAKLTWRPAGTEWAEYGGGEETSYDDEALAAKKRLVEAMVRATAGPRLWDIGANMGLYSGIAADAGKRVVALDVDPAAAERHYQTIRGTGRAVLPLVVDLTNPSPGLGWAHAERASLADRAGADVILALAVVHHLAISRNVPLPLISGYLARLAPELIIEFVPKEDPMVRRLLATRRDVFPDYSLDGFRRAFATDFETVMEAPIPSSQRVLFQLRRRPGSTPATEAETREPVAATPSR